MTSISLPARPPGFLKRPAFRWPIRGESGALLRLALPVTGLALVNMAMSVTDTVMTAGFGSEALAAVAVASDFYSILFYLAIGCIGGMAPLYAAAHARGELSRLARLRGSGWFVAVLCTAPMVGLLLAAPALLNLFGIDRELVEMGRGYSRAMAWTFVPMVAIAVIRTRLTAIERPGVMLRITLAAVPLNALFNYLFMHGAAGIQGLGITGAGVSSLLVSWIIFAALAFESRRLGDQGAGLPEWRTVGEILRIGLPIGIATLAEVGIYLGATVYAATLSATDAAAHAIAIRTAGITYALYVGLGQAAMVRIARCGDAVDRQLEIVRAALRMGRLAGVFLLLVILAATGPLTTLLLDSTGSETARVATVLLVLLALADGVGPWGAAAGGLLRGLKVTRPVMTISLVGNWLVAAPVAIALTVLVDGGAIGIWIGLIAGTIVSSAMTVLWLKRRVLSPSSHSMAGSPGSRIQVPAG